MNSGSNLSWNIDPNGDLGIRKYFESPYEAGRKLRVDEYYRWIFENSRSWTSGELQQKKVLLRWNT